MNLNDSVVAYQDSFLQISINDAATVSIQKQRTEIGMLRSCSLPKLSVTFIMVSLFGKIFFPILSLKLSIICCVFRPANRCSACRLLIEIDFLMLKQLFPSLTKQNKQKIKGKPSKSCRTCSKRGGKQSLGVTL